MNNNQGDEQVTDPRAVANTLRSYAEHFSKRDWDYTRKTGDLRPLHYGSRWPSIKRAVGYLAKGATGILPEARPSRIRMARAALRSYNSKPDGVLDGGNIITHWEETGEYLQFVQPTVGSLIADFLEREPDHPHAQLIAAEMDRIQRRYADRLKEEA